MNRKHQRQSLVTKALLAALALAFLVAPALAETPCEQAAKWVEAHRDALPQTLEDFVTVPEAFRGAAFMALPADERAELWSSHLEKFVADHPELAAEERAQIAALGDLFDSEEAITKVEDVDLLRGVLAEFGPEVGDQQITVLPARLSICNCNPTYDNPCSGFCIPTDVGCGPENVHPCTRRFP